MVDAGDGPDRGIPERTDRHLVGVYLNDHLAGSVAGSQRFDRLAHTLRSTPVGAQIAVVAGEVAEEREELRRIVGDLGVTQNLLKQAAAWAGERVARLKASRQVLRRSTMSTLLEVELHRSALMGKRGTWQTLRDLAPELGLDQQRMADLLEQTERQLATMDDVHAYVRVRALIARRRERQRSWRQRAES